MVKMINKGKSTGLLLHTIHRTLSPFRYFGKPILNNIPPREKDWELQAATHVGPELIIYRNGELHFEEHCTLPISFEDF